MTTIFDVAKYILQKLGSTTTMKLQKLAYYCQAWSLAWDDIPLFEEDFQAWANGPVCPELFQKHKGAFFVDSSLLSDLPKHSFSDDQTETLENVLNYYGDKDPVWLSESTHQESPWKEARGNTPMGEHCINIIDKESMRQYYGGLVV